MTTLGMQSAWLQQHMRDLLATASSSLHILKDHPQISVMIDILSRKENHHLNLSGVYSEKIQLAFLESIALHLTEGNAPHVLRDIEFIYLDVKRLTSFSENSDSIIHDFFTFCETLQQNAKRIILAVNNTDITEEFSRLIDSLALNEQWRIISLTTNNRSSFVKMKLIPPSHTQLLNLLKTYKLELESYHHVLIPEEAFTSALSLAAHYLTSQSYFDKALELIDSACARASTMDHNDPTGQFKPLVSSITLSQIISSWTQIPLSNLYNNSFQASKFIEALQRRVYGQETAVAYMGSILQHAYIKLQEKSGPLCTFLIVGAREVGKTTAAQAIAEHLFGHKNALLRVNLHETYLSIDDVTITTEESHALTLLDAIQQTPYAIVFLENVHHASAVTLNLFKPIFSHGYAQDAQGNQYDFKHAIFILTTTFGSEQITTLTQAPMLVETNKTLDLMQLVLSEHTQESGDQTNQPFSLQELCEELTPLLENYFSPALLQHLHVVPFIPLDYLALEKVMRMKIKLLAQRLEMNYGIELNYAPEVIKFLAHEAFWRKPQSKTIEKLLEFHLYGAVANEILSRADDKNRPRQLLIQLNEDGQLLRCETGSNLSSVF